MAKIILSVIPILLALTSYSQSYLNPGVDTSFPEVKSALSFYNTYLSEFKGKKIPDMTKYWSRDEIKLRNIPDQFIYAQNDFPLYSQGYRPTILYIRPTDKYVQIKTQFSITDSSKNIITMAVTNHYVAFDHDHLPYFLNPMTKNLTSWLNKTVRNVIFYYPKYHTFNPKRADSLISSVVKLEKEWGLQPIGIRYYLADDNDELYKLRGFDYALLMGNKKKPSGISDDKDKQVFCAGLGENYFHEVVHLYLNQLYPKSPIQEGLAVMYAGSMGHPVEWHLKRVNQYLIDHPDADLGKVGDFWYADPYTNPSSTIQGMICNIVYKRDGISGLKRLMLHTSYKDIFEKEFRVKSDQLNAFLRKTIKEEGGN